jgi:hypothetical protein
MDPQFSKLVQDAAEIATSGRWSAVNTAIKRQAANAGVDNAWYVQVFGALCFKVFSEYLMLKSAHTESREGDASLLAWRARNLLELSVWSVYFSKSKENARRIYEDAGRDALGVFSAFETWGKATAQDSDWLQLFTSAKQDLSQRAESEGIETLDGSYKQVHEAAKECGMGDHFRLMFRMLSKFAHPTAMQVLSLPDEAKNILQRDCFFSQGCLFFTGAFAALESHLDEYTNFTSVPSPRDPTCK